MKQNTGKKFLEYLQTVGITPARKGNSVIFKRGSREVSKNALSTIAREYLHSINKADIRQRVINLLIKDTAASVPIEDLPSALPPPH